VKKVKEHTAYLKKETLSLMKRGEGLRKNRLTQVTPGSRNGNESGRRKETNAKTEKRKSGTVTKQSEKGGGGGGGGWGGGVGGGGGGGGGIGGGGGALGGVFFL